ncbi:ribonuclease H-like domain-containing protein [Tanacetum coccineum]|uniref:Ribonuclease H-like domain-containing protein n=1 Tax=Tanacetum coccineum TaxID=301880 RepID=A0ABQ5FNL2_9ASTR
MDLHDLSNTLQQRLIVEDPQTTKEALDLIASIFNDNKRTRSIALKAEFHFLKLGDLSIDAYFRKFESIATILTSLGSLISNDDVVTIALDGLSDKYDNVYGIIVHREPFSDLTGSQDSSFDNGSPIDSTYSLPLVLLANGGNNTRHPDVASKKPNYKGQLGQQSPPGQSGQQGKSGQPSQMGQHVSLGQSCQLSWQTTTLPNDFNVMKLQDTVAGNWNMDTGASSHLTDSVYSLSEIFKMCIYLSVSVGDGYSIPVTNFGDSILPTPHRPLHLKNVLITHNIVKNLIYRWRSLAGHEAFIPHAFLTSQYAWHQRLGNLGSEVLRLLLSSNSISCNKEIPLVLWHACQLGKHVPFVSSSTLVQSCFEMVYSDLWTSPISNLSGSKYYCDHGGEFDNHAFHKLFASNIGLLNYILGISVGSNSSRMFLSQRKYAVEILERTHMVKCNPNRTSIDTESKLGSDGDPVSNPTLYHSLVGALQYLTFTRSDISYAVPQVCLYMHDHREPHFSALKRILRYVRGTLDHGLQSASSTTSLIAYSYGDWVGYPITRRSTFGYFVFLGNNLLSWSSKRQPTLSRSSVEAEYHGVANVVAETCWLRNLLRELHTPLSSATLVYCDNVSVIYLSSNPVQHQRTKHIEIDIHFVRDLIAAG